MSYFSSSALASFKALLVAHPALRSVAGELVEYVVVIDANVVVADILHKYRNPQVEKTAIEEACLSSTLRVHAPRWLDIEMTRSAIPQVARATGIAESELLKLWISYRELLIWDEGSTAPGDVESDGLDPKDVPYVALQDAIGAVGILTKDRGIEKLGGRKLTLEFVLSVRQYARATTYITGIRIGGTLIGYISIAGFVSGVRRVAAVVVRLPPLIRIACLISVLVVALHPQLRARAFSLLETTYGAVKALWPELQNVILLMEEKQRDAEAARKEVARLLSTADPPIV